MSLPYAITIQPISIQNSSGHVTVLSSYSSEIALFEQATQEVFAQEGIRVNWASWNTYVDSTNTYYSINGTQTQLDGLTQTAGHGQNAHTTYGQNAQAGDVINLWFTGPSGGILGYSEQSINTSFTDAPVFKNGATVSETVFNSASYFSLMTIAHEVNHVLGLTHNLINSGPSYSSTAITTKTNLMYGGSSPILVTSLSQITKDGTTGNGTLTSNQLQMVRLNPMIVTNPVAGDTYTYPSNPEPSDYAIGAGLLAFGWQLVRKYRNRKSAQRIAIARGDSSTSDSAAL